MLHTKFDADAFRSQPGMFVLREFRTKIKINRMVVRTNWSNRKAESAFMPAMLSDKTW
jgi:hypothetical protein